MKNNASFLQRSNITINSFGRYAGLLYNDHLSITTAETSSLKWLLYTGLTVVISFGLAMVSSLLSLDLNEIIDLILFHVFLM